MIIMQHYPNQTHTDVCLNKHSTTHDSPRLDNFISNMCETLASLVHLNAWCIMIYVY